jgi:hypothetical protein
MVSWTKIAAVTASIVSVGSIVGYMSGAVVWKDAYAQEQAQQTARTDENTIRLFNYDIRPLLSERRELKRYLRHMPDDEETLEDLDEVNLQLIELLSEKCGLMEGLGKKCPRNELKILTGED